jgi:hypothetical protein
MLIPFNVSSFGYICLTNVRKLEMLTVEISSKYLQLLLNKLISECFDGSLWNLAICI